MLKGHLGLEHARLPHADRHGLLYLERGALSVVEGCLRFIAAGSDLMVAGDYQIPHQSLSMLLLGPGSTVSHDALRLLARHGTGLSAVGEDGVRFYTAPPLLPDSSALARAQVRAWADATGARMSVARRMYAWRLGEVLPHREIAIRRGIEVSPPARGGPYMTGGSTDQTAVSPPARGWPQVRPEHVCWIRGFPACVGMAPRLAAATDTKARFPRLRGDGPQTAGGLGISVPGGFPACAGMAPMLRTP